MERGTARLPVARLVDIAPSIARATAVDVEWLIGDPDDLDVFAPVHGTTHRYKMGCRCDECRAAISAYYYSRKPSDD